MPINENNNREELIKYSFISSEILNGEILEIINLFFDENFIEKNSKSESSEKNDNLFDFEECGRISHRGKFNNDNIQKDDEDDEENLDYKNEENFEQTDDDILIKNSSVINNENKKIYENEPDEEIFNNNNLNENDLKQKDADPKNQSINFYLLLVFLIN